MSARDVVRKAVPSGDSQSTVAPVKKQAVTALAGRNPQTQKDNRTQALRLRQLGARGALGMWSAKPFQEMPANQWLRQLKERADTPIDSCRALAAERQKTQIHCTY